MLLGYLLIDYGIVASIYIKVLENKLMNLITVIAFSALELYKVMPINNTIISHTE